MSPDTKLQLAELANLSIDQLAAKYEKLFGEKCRSRNRRYVYRRVAWRLQADDEGGLSERAILRATAIAGESLLRVTPPRSPKQFRTAQTATPANWDSRLPPPGQVIERTYKGRLLCVMVMTDGFEFEGECYKSLTALARTITGSHCNGLPQQWNNLAIGKSQVWTYAHIKPGESQISVWLMMSTSMSPVF